MLTEEEEQFVRDMKEKKELQQQIMQKESIMWGKVEIMKSTGDWAGIKTEKAKCRTDTKPMEDRLNVLK